jgi:antitoxin component YwqK of YwqJK toxin-antitoxin module
MASEKRLNSEEVFDQEMEFDDDMLLHLGNPFTGIIYSLYPNSSLRHEHSYKDGFHDGLCRDWYSNGQLKKERVFRRGQTIGKVTEWHENGKIKSIKESEYGIELEYDE